MHANDESYRIARAMIECAAEYGYAQTEVADVVATAGVTRDRFHELFEDRLTCLLHAYESLLDTIFGRVSSAWTGSEGEHWQQRIRAALLALLNEFAAAPAGARFMLIEVPGAGPEARELYSQGVERFTAFFTEGFKASPAGPSLPKETPRIAAITTAAMILDEVNKGRTEELPSKLDAILFAAVVPFVGPMAAADPDAG